MQEFGIKELYDIAIKATQPIKIGDTQYDTGQVIVFLDRAQLGGLMESSSRVFARGGKENRRLIMWKSEQPIQLQVQQGVISKESLSVLTNNFLSKDATESPIRAEDERLVVPFRKKFILPVYEQQDKYEFELDPHVSGEQKIFVTNQSGKNINKRCGFYTTNTVEDSKTNIEEYYKFEVDTKDKDGQEYDDIRDEYYILDGYYLRKGKVLNIGKDAWHGYLRLEARTRIKDDTYGYEKTGIIIIPKMRIMSDLSIRLGDSITPMVYGFTIEGEPVGAYGESKVADLYFLENDLDAEDLV